MFLIVLYLYLRTCVCVCVCAWVFCVFCVIVSSFEGSCKCTFVPCCPVRSIVIWLYMFYCCLNEINTTIVKTTIITVDKFRRVTNYKHTGWTLNTGLEWTRVTNWRLVKKSPVFRLWKSDNPSWLAIAGKRFLSFIYAITPITVWTLFGRSNNFDSSDMSAEWKPAFFIIDVT